MNPPQRSPQSGRHSRAAFVTRAGAAALGVLAGSGSAEAADPAAHAGSPLQAKGGKDSKVRRWDVVTIGNLSRNRYWGESDARGVRAAICTCTLIQGEGFRLLVDPSLSSAEQMAVELDRRTGLKPRDIDTVFITHEHGDHLAGLPHFLAARWVAGPEAAAVLNAAGKLPKRVEAAPSRLFDALDLVPTPGHTLSLCSLRFDCDGFSVFVTGDAVATRDFWRERRGYYNCVDFDLARKSMDQIARLADIVVPGHDNFFLVNRTVG